MTVSTNYSPNFTRRELTISPAALRHGINNVPSAAQDKNLVRLCTDFLEPTRTRFGPLRISSGYRGPALNALIGGSKTSAHMDARAADFEPVLGGEKALRTVIEWLIQSALPFDQVIYEFGQWVHLGIAIDGAPPRRQALQVFRPGIYEPYHP